MTVQPQSYTGSPGRPSWSADSKKVAVRLNRKAVLVNKDDQTVFSEIGPKDANIGAPQFSPDGTKLAYDIYTEVPGAEKKQWAVAVSDSQGKNQEILADHGRRPRWSPDGEQLAFSSYTDDFQTEVSVVDVQSKEQRVVSQRPYYTDFSWSPDGSKIAYEATNDVAFDLRTVELESGEEKILTNGDNNAYTDRSPVWSPSGKTIVFERRHKRFPAGSIWSVEAESGVEKQLFQRFSDAVDPVFTADGKTLIFGSNHGGRGGLDLFAMDLNDLSIAQLTDLPGDEHSPSISPDGKTIAFFNTDRRRETGERTRLHFQATPPE